MCLALWRMRSPLKKYRSIIMFNREEFAQRPFFKLGFWPTNQDILGGFDVSTEGTWLGFNIKTGNFTFLTNYPHMPFKIITDMQYSRGNLTKTFLHSKQAYLSPSQIKDQINQIFLNEKDAFNGVNLFYGNLHSQECFYASNAPYTGEQPVKIPKKTSQSMTNGYRGNDWKKGQVGLKLFDDILNESIDISESRLKNRLLQMMLLTKKAKISQIPKEEGHSDDYFLDDSSIFVERSSRMSTDTLHFGTIWTGLFLVTRNNSLHAYERVYNQELPAHEFENHLSDRIFRKNGIKPKDFKRINYEENFIRVKLDNPDH